MTRETYDEVLAAVTDAARVYRGGVSDRGVADNVEAAWSPIYADLRAELATWLRASGADYDKSADELGIPAAQRFDWRALLAEP